MQYRRAGWQSADETLSVTPRAYRPVMKDPAPWGVSKPTAHAAPAKGRSPERAGAERSEPPPLRAADAAEGQRAKWRRAPDDIGSAAGGGDADAVIK